MAGERMSVQQALVLSSGRSGSTLLDRLLGLHPQVRSLGEVVHWPKTLTLDEPCTCGERMTQCPFWCSVAKHLQHSLGVDVLRDPYALDMGLIGATHVRDERYYTLSRRMENRLAQGWLWAGMRMGKHWASPLVRRQNQHSLAVYDAVRALSGSAVVVDSSKQYLRAISLYRQEPQYTRLIMLVRDGRAVLHSRMQTGLSMEEAVQRWKRYYQRMQPCLSASVPAHAVFQLRYEQLAAHPQDTLQQLFRFLGLEACDVLSRSESDVHMAAGNAMRFKPLGPIAPDVRWQSGLPAGARDYFERHAGQLNRQLGYHDD